MMLTSSHSVYRAPMFTPEFTPECAVALTVKKIDSLKPRADRYEAADGGGLYLVIYPSGKKSWALRYRAPGSGLARKLTLGEIDGPTARDRAADARKRIKLGFDPGSEALEAKAKARDRSNLVGDLMDDYLKKYRSEHKARTADEVERLFDVRARPFIGNMRIDEVTRRDVQGLIDRMVRDGAAISGNRLLAVLRPFFRAARVGGEPLPFLPTDGVDKPASEAGRSRDRVLDDREIKWLWTSTGDASAFSALVRLLLLTGARRSEASGLTSDELDLDAERPMWVLPAARAKNSRIHMVPLAPVAVEVIRQPVHIGRSRLIFTSTVGGEISGWAKLKRSLDDRMVAAALADTGRRINLQPWTLHDLRRSAATHMAGLGVDPHIVEACLNHASGTISGVAGTYNRFAYLDQKASALTMWADKIQAIVS